MRQFDSDQGREKTVKLLWLDSLFYKLDWLSIAFSLLSFSDYLFNTDNYSSEIQTTIACTFNHRIHSEESLPVLLPYTQNKKNNTCKKA